MFKYLFLFASGLFLLTSCWFYEGKKSEKENEGKVIAKVHGEYLYEDDLRKIAWNDLDAKDSMNKAHQIIDNWVQEKLIYHKALANLTDDEKNVEKELNQYRSSLIKYKYIEKIVTQRLNTNVTPAEIERYYQENLEVFKLKRCIIRLIYLRLPVNAPDLTKVRKWYLSKEFSDLDLLHQYCISHAAKFNLDDSKWYYSDEIERDIPSNIRICSSTQDQFSKEIADSNFICFLNVLEIKREGSTSPIEFEKESIKNIILQKRRVDLIKKLEEAIYNEGIEKNYFQIYD